MDFLLRSALDYLDQYSSIALEVFGFFLAKEQALVMPSNNLFLSKVLICDSYAIYCILYCNLI